jgi:hypothetical protein
MRPIVRNVRTAFLVAIAIACDLTMTSRAHDQLIAPRTATNRFVSSEQLTVKPRKLDPTTALLLEMREHVDSVLSRLEEQKAQLQRIQRKLDETIMILRHSLANE